MIYNISTGSAADSFAAAASNRFTASRMRDTGLAGESRLLKGGSHESAQFIGRNNVITIVC